VEKISYVWHYTTLRACEGIKRDGCLKSQYQIFSEQLQERPDWNEIANDPQAIEALKRKNMDYIFLNQPFVWFTKRQTWEPAALPLRNVEGVQRHITDIENKCAHFEGALMRFGLRADHPRLLNFDELHAVGSSRAIFRFLYGLRVKAGVPCEHEYYAVLGMTLSLSEISRIDKFVCDVGWVPVFDEVRTASANAVLTVE